MSIDKTKKKVVPIVMEKEKDDLIKKIRINQYGGNISIGAMYRILLDKGYDVVARDQLKLRQSVRV